MNFNLSYLERTSRKIRRDIYGTIPAITEPPLITRLAVIEIAKERLCLDSRFSLGQPYHIPSREHLVVDTYLIDVAPPDILKPRINLLGADHLSMGSELVEASIKDGGDVNLSG